MDEMYEDMTIDELSIDEMVKEALKKAGFKYVRQLENENIGSIDEVISLGCKYIEKLEEQLYLLGVEFKDERDDNDTKDRFEKWRRENALRKSEKRDFKSVAIIKDNKNSEDKDKNSEVRSDEGERG